MQISVFALVSVPDTATTRDMFELDDLDERAVSKVLFHRRKQQTGSSEVLRWDQRAIAGLSLVRHTAGGPKLESLKGGARNEEAMLRDFFQRIANSGRVVSWDGARHELPLLRFRSLKHAVRLPATWGDVGHSLDPDGHTDIANWLSGADIDRPTLDEMARKLGFPGMLERTEYTAMDAWLAGDPDEVQAYSDLAALNTYLLALRMFTVSGEMAQAEAAAALDGLPAAIGEPSGRHLRDFLAAWGRT